MLNDDICRAKAILSNGVLEVKFTLGSYTKILIFLKETELFSHSHYLHSNGNKYFLNYFFLLAFYEVKNLLILPQIVFASFGSPTKTRVMLIIREKR